MSRTPTLSRTVIPTPFRPPPPTLTLTMALSFRPRYFISKSFEFLFIIMMHE
jgi:hypothetical protein